MDLSKSDVHKFFQEGEGRSIVPPATGVVIFGASGDLAERKLLPALYDLRVEGYLPQSFFVIGVSRKEWSDEDFRTHVEEAVRKNARSRFQVDTFQSFRESLYYCAVDGTNAEDFVKLTKRVEELESKEQHPFNLLFYLATAPKFFEVIARNLKGCGLVEDPHSARRSTRVVIEKPFGHDLVSAKELNRKLGEQFHESQIFRIDHYLGKETVQNILVFRFANGIFEPIWNNRFIDHIQIAVCESVGIEGRAPYFDENGIVRDIAQNHVLQLLSLLCIEPPNSLSHADAIRDEKVKVLEALVPFTQETVRSRCIRGQYTDGIVHGQKVPGYLQEEGIPASTYTETYAALQLEVDNWRWSGVPIFLRVGKRLPKRITEIIIQFKKPPGSLFKGRLVGDLTPNVLAIQIQPQESISLTMLSKPPGPRLRARPVKMDFSYDESFGVDSPEAYERLLLDAMRGDATLFTRDDEIESAWRLLDPVLHHWREEKGNNLYTYSAGTWGPEESVLLPLATGRKWRAL